MQTDSGLSLRRALALAAKAARRETAARICAVAPTRIGPVMLDPKGFSPGGTPNWYLNMRRLERAGLRKAV